MIDKFQPFFHIAFGSFFIQIPHKNFHFFFFLFDLKMVINFHFCNIHHPENFIILDPTRFKAPSAFKISMNFCYSFGFWKKRTFKFEPFFRKFYFFETRPEILGFGNNFWRNYWEFVIKNCHRDIKCH